MEDNVIKAIEALPNMRHLQPATSEEIAAAENMLQLRFAEDYLTYTTAFGAISARGIELTGVTSVKRLSVVEVTARERKLSHLPRNLYVLEDTGIDGLLILQDQTGKIFSVTPHGPVKNVCGSLTEYILRGRK